jgi:hypothetical protein
VERVVLNALAEDASGSRLILILFFSGSASARRGGTITHQEIRAITR